MIPRAHVTAWRAQAPWPADAQVEQDLVLSRALVEMFGDPVVARSCAFRGGTALHKLFLSTPGRYSEDIDLVQTSQGPIGPALDAMRAALDPWLGSARWKQGDGRVTLTYRFQTTMLPSQHARLKIEINTREHFRVLAPHTRTLVIDSPWFSGAAPIATYPIEEILGTKLRALYQRRKGRDLYDLWLALMTTEADEQQIIECFDRYMEHGGAHVSRAEFEENLKSKLQDPVFLHDMQPLLPSRSSYDVLTAGELVLTRLVGRLAGEPWKGRQPRKR